MTPTLRAIAREAQPSAASRTIRARRTMRCSVVDARSQPSSSLRVSGSSRISVALGIIPMLNHGTHTQQRQAARMSGHRSLNDSAFFDGGY